ncbi:YjcZ family sporulation protein [Bacillus clarus]|uniref:YjcZ family sporulation protein n=1 Tax=Bacillus clarus TaxID=2338372 RepID=A0ABX9L156_9BACI|nr:YjcZ family sporulation protein [Bacillus clarus]RFT68599.1 YjcZ family sporulation protein [Bacillus clarus]
MSNNYYNSFTLMIVLFILLIIVRASCTVDPIDPGFSKNLYNTILSLYSLGRNIRTKSFILS